MFRTMMVAAALGVAVLAAAPPAQALETLEVGGVGSANAVTWPHYIAEAKGLYKEQGLAIDLIYSQSNAAVLQALTAGSTQISIASGLTDPIYAVASGAGVALVRIDGRVGPYALMAGKDMKTNKDLKGHVI